MATAVLSGFRCVRRKGRKPVTFRRGVAIRWAVLAIASLFGVNLLYQIGRKPVELLAPVSRVFAKTPKSTWENYGELFKIHSTDIIPAELLAALAQVESDGNPLARTYWRWQWSWNLFEIYRPASSALGMFQVTDGTFAEARKYCIQDHIVRDGDFCWFNAFYMRTIPSHSVELTAAYLHQRVVHALAAYPKRSATSLQKQRLAAVIHLCGAKKGESFVARSFRVSAGEQCGAHGLGEYLTKVERMKKRFARLAEG